MDGWIVCVLAVLLMFLKWMGAREEEHVSGKFHLGIRIAAFFQRFPHFPIMIFALLYLILSFTTIYLPPFKQSED